MGLDLAEGVKFVLYFKLAGGTFGPSVNFPKRKRSSKRFKM